MSLNLTLRLHLAYLFSSFYRCLVPILFFSNLSALYSVVCNASTAYILLFDSQKKKKKKIIEQISNIQYNLVSFISFQIHLETV